MKNEFLKSFDPGFRRLNQKQRCYAVYFLFSFLLLCTVGDGILWMAAVLANLANSVRLLKRIPLDCFED